MDAERFAQLRRLYDAMVDMPPTARAAALAKAGTDAELAAEVLALCEADDADRTGALTGLRDSALDAAIEPLPAAGEIFGAWRIVEEIGHGGMGRVYRVQRSDGSYEQTAALKFIKGLAGADAVANFTRERQLLAGLVHPHIARLLDGGSSNERPYLVMEYIVGLPIDEYCAQRKLDADKILDVFVTTCAAVSYAHHQLIVHCDLKPSNILVTPQGQPMLLDFGIAQLSERAGGEADAAPGSTSQGYTPGYASPEQRRGERVGVASDIYSLGVVLRDMLNDAGVVPGKELAAILAMATRDDAAARYTSVDALCEDIARLRSHHPVRALPADASYRLSRFVLRNAVALTIVAGVVALSALFTWKVIAESHRAQAAEQVALGERDRARRAESEARASEAAARETSEFLISVFKGANPDAGSGNVSIATVLDQALLRVERDLADQPATQAQMSAALAEVLFVIGQNDRGRALYARAIALERKQDRPLVLAKVLLDNANTFLKYKPTATPDEDVREALRLVESHTTEDSPLRLDLTLEGAAILGDTDPSQARPFFERSLVLTRKLKPASMALAEVLGTYGWNERRSGNFEHAIALMQEANALQLRLLGEAHEEYALQMEALANTMSLAHRFDEADPLFLRAQALHRQHGRMDSKMGAWSLGQYASFLVNAGRAKEAPPVYDEIFAIAARKLPPDDGSVLVWKKNFADANAAAGDLQRASALNSEVLAEARRRWGPNDGGTAIVLLAQARYAAWKDCDTEAGKALDEVLAIYTRKAPQDESDVYVADVQRVRWLISCNRLNEAQAQLAEVTPHAAELKPVPAQQLALAQALLRLQRDGDDAALTELKKAEAQAEKVFVRGDARIALAQLPRAEWLHAHARGEEVAKLVTSMLASLEGKLVANSPWLARIRALRESPK